MRADAQKNYDHLLAVARDAIAEHGVDASLRDIARRANVGLGTLYRHFPSREVLLETLLRSSLDALTQTAGELETTRSPEEALVSWLRDALAFTRTYSGVVAMMAGAIADPDSALHESCTTVRAAGARLLRRAQTAGKARSDIDGADLLALVAGLAWLSDQPSLAPHPARLFDVIVSAILSQRA